MKNRYLKLLSFILSFSIIAVPLYGCSKKAEDNELVESTQTTIYEILETILEEEIQTSQTSIEQNEILETIEETTEGTTEETILEEAIEIVDLGYVLSPEELTWEDYAGNMDMFVYGLLIDQISLDYDCFNAAVELEDGSSMYGIAFTDYGSFFEVVDDDDTEEIEGYFPAGFIPYLSDTLDYSEIDSAPDGLEVINLDYDNPQYKFFLGYESDTFTSHCVVWNQYLQYGIDEFGDIFYTSTDYVEDDIDKSIGTLYSYDEERNVYEGAYGGGKPITGDSLSYQIDYEQLKSQVDEILKQQDDILAYVDVETCAYVAQERLEAFLLTKQNETFMGYDVDVLIEYAKTLDPLECIQITPDGIEIVGMFTEIPEEPSALVKWLVGINCGINVVASFVVPFFIPALTPVCGAVGAAASDVFIQVIFDNQTLKNVNWAKVGISAASGAALAWICPAIASKAAGAAVNAAGKVASQAFSTAIGELTGYTVLTISNSIVGGATEAAFAYIDGKSDEEVFNAFLFGAALSGALTMATCVAGKGLTSMMKNINAKSSLGKLLNNAGGFIKDHQVVLFADKYGNPTMLEKLLTPVSIEKAALLAWNELKYGNEFNFANEMMLQKNKALMNVNKVTFYDNETGQYITKKEVFTLESVSMIPDRDVNPEIFDDLEELGLSVIPIKNKGEFDWEKMSFGSFDLDITDSRPDNYDRAAEKVWAMYLEDSSDLPAKLKEAISTYLSDKNLAFLSENQVTEIVNSVGITYHEWLGKIYLVPTKLHNFLGHAGGVYYASKVSEFFCQNMTLEDFSKYSPLVIFGTLVAA